MTKPKCLRMLFSSLKSLLVASPVSFAAGFYFRFFTLCSAFGLFGRLRLLGSLDALDHESARFIRVAPANDLYPLVGFKILVVREEMLDLLDRNRWQVRVIVHMRVALGEFRRRHGEELLVLAPFVLHDQDADNLATHDRARNDRARVGDDHVARIAVARERMGNEAVISRIAHRGVEKPIDLKRAALLVHLVLDRLAAAP